MDIDQKLKRLTEMVEQARSMAWSASCIINRNEALTLLDEIREAFPSELHHAQILLEQRDAVIAEGQAAAERIVEEARIERDRLVSEHEISQAARVYAQETRAQANAEAERKRQEIDDYVDQKLANFEIVLNKTLAAVHSGREKLHGHSPKDELRELAQDERA